MIANSLKERMSSYEELTDTKLISKLPVITVVNGRSFKKTTSLIAKPYSQKFMDAMCALMVKMFQEIDGTVIGYCFNDEIVLISRNDYNINTMPYCSNNIQKIVSTISSVATIEFHKILQNTNINILGDATFTCKSFAVPNINEAVNLLVYKQQQSLNISLYLSCFYELIKKYNIEDVKESLINKSVQERLDLLMDMSNIDFNNYSLPFRAGALAYRVPKVINTPGGSEIRAKVIIDQKVPLFSKDQELIHNVIMNGKSIIKY